MKRKMMIFVPYEGFFELHPPQADGTKKRQGRTLRKQPAAVFSEGARWRVGGQKEHFFSQLEKV
ncbi:MAG: hypothetical protein WDZ45_09420 [Flavobacteriaceae bacterium]